VSSHLRSGFVVLFLAAGFSTPAASNVLTDLFSTKAAPEESTAAAAHAQEECSPQPGGSTAAGQHWVYRYAGQRRKCWFQTAEDTDSAKKPVRHRVVRKSAPTLEDDKPALRKQKDIGDARAELLSSAPAEASQPAPPAPTLKMVRAVPVRVADAAGLVIPPVPVIAASRADRLAPDQPAPRRVDVDSLLAEAPAVSDQIASAPPATLIAGPGAKTDGDDDWTTSWLGVLLMALGATALLSSSRALRRAIWPVQFLKFRAEVLVIEHGGRNEPAFVQRASHRPELGETSF
jgi:hypothetical protein